MYNFKKLLKKMNLENLSKVFIQSQAGMIFISLPELELLVLLIMVVDGCFIYLRLIANLEFHINIIK
jgi:hypothetical protein